MILRRFIWPIWFRRAVGYTYDVDVNSARLTCISFEDRTTVLPFEDRTQVIQKEGC